MGYCQVRFIYIQYIIRMAGLGSNGAIASRELRRGWAGSNGFVTAVEMCGKV